MIQWKLKLLFISASMLAVAVLALAKPGVVTMSDGSRLEGEVIERNNDVVVKRYGVETVVQREQILSIDYRTFEERFRLQMAELDPSDSEGRIQLAREAFERREYSLAIEAIDQAVLIDPINISARDLADVIRRQAQVDASDASTKSAPPVSRPRSRREGLMNEDQINRIRLYEMRPGDRQMRIHFRAKVRQRYVAQHPPMTFRQFNAQSDVDQALMIRDHGSADMIDDLRVMNDPPALEIFVNQIEPTIVRGCATSRCHGGPNGGDFRLISPSTSRESRYTNYHIVMNYARRIEADSNKVFAAPIGEMVRRGQSANSLLTQYALPRNKTTMPHPDVKRFSPLVYSADHSIYQDMVMWMDNLLQPLAPEYGFEFSYTFDTVDEPELMDEMSASDEASDEPSTQPTTETSTE